MGKAAARRQEIVALLRSRNGPVRKREIQRVLGLSKGYLSDLLSVLTVQGIVQSTPQGYKLWEG